MWPFNKPIEPKTSDQFICQSCKEIFDYYRMIGIKKLTNIEKLFTEEIKIKHVHADLIKAWADGAEIQCLVDSEWAYVENPVWNSDIKYRIKPQPKPDIIKEEAVFLYLGGDNLMRLSWDGGNAKYNNLRLMFDGETKILKSAEVIK